MKTSIFALCLLATLNGHAVDYSVAPSAPAKVNSLDEAMKPSVSIATGDRRPTEVHKGSPHDTYLKNDAKYQAYLREQEAIKRAQSPSRARVLNQGGHEYVTPVAASPQVNASAEREQRAQAEQYQREMQANARQQTEIARQQQELARQQQQADTKRQKEIAIEQAQLERQRQEADQRAQTLARQQQEAASRTQQEAAYRAQQERARQQQYTPQPTRPMQPATSGGKGRFRLGG